MCGNKLSEMIPLYIDDVQYFNLVVCFMCTYKLSISFYVHFKYLAYNYSSIKLYKTLGLLQESTLEMRTVCSVNKFLSELQVHTSSFILK